MVIGIGLDLVETARVERRARAARRALRRQAHGPGGGGRPARGRPERARALALAVAGKEAASKALGTGWSQGVRWRDVVVSTGPEPAVRLDGRAAEVARQLGSSGRGRVRLEVRGAARARRVLAPLVTPRRRSARRNQLVTVAMVFAVFTGFAFVLPFLPLFVRELGVEEPERAALWAGVLIGVAPLLAGLLAPVWGRLADRHGHKGIAAKALVAYVVILALSAAVTRVEQLLALRIGIGLFGGIGPLGLAMATAQAPREETGRAVGLIQAAQILSAAIGPLAGGLLADAIGIRRTFLVTAALCALALVLVLAFYEERGHAERTAAGPSPGFGAVVALPGVMALLVRALPRQLHRPLVHADPAPAPRRRSASPPRASPRPPAS